MEIKGNTILLQSILPPSSGMLKVGLNAFNTTKSFGASDEHSLRVAFTLMLLEGWNELKSAGLLGADAADVGSDVLGKVEGLLLKATLTIPPELQPCTPPELLTKPTQCEPQFEQLHRPYTAITAVVTPDANFNNTTNIISTPITHIEGG